ncbi:MAG: dihydropteroate synthase [Saprospiraceae bacterium]|nr:dihydropteroate synthase [Saprospiraceae bacterium]
MLNPFWQTKMSLNCKGRLIKLQPAVVMGILNSTPDSFYPGSRLDSPQAGVDRAGSMIEEGATILDIGGYSSRPGAEDISAAEELDRVLPLIQSVRTAFPETPLSVDTFRSDVARQAIDAGASMINDISGGQLDREMWALAADHQIPYVLMHMPGTPQNMQSNTQYQDVAMDVLDWLIEQVGHLRTFRMHDIIVDPGFGFGKTISQNFRLLHQLHTLRIMGLPIMVGLSRKSMVWKTLHRNADTALEGTTALHMIALQQGAHILRVHDVQPAMDAIRLWAAYADQHTEEAIPANT